MHKRKENGEKQIDKYRHHSMAQIKTDREKNDTDKDILKNYLTIEKNSEGK